MSHATIPTRTGRLARRLCLLVASAVLLLAGRLSAADVLVSFDDNDNLVLSTNMSPAVGGFADGNTYIEIRGTKDFEDGSMVYNVIPREGTTLDGSPKFQQFSNPGILCDLKNSAGQNRLWIHEVSLQNGISVLPLGSGGFVDVDLEFCDVGGDIVVASEWARVIGCTARKISVGGRFMANVEYCDAQSSLFASALDVSLFKCSASRIRITVGNGYQSGAGEVRQCTAGRNLEIYGRRGRDLLTIDAVGAGQLIIATAGDNDDIALSNCFSLLQPKVDGGSGKDDWVRDLGGHNFDKLAYSNTQNVEHFKYE